MCSDGKLAHYDLDPIAWLPTTPPKRASLSACQKLIDQFISENSAWVIEGCYSDLLEIAIPNATELIYLDLTVEDCVANAKNRPWEPHKYESKELQDANLNMLIGWIQTYPTRSDSCSKSAHESLYNQFCGYKSIIKTNAR